VEQGGGEVEPAPGAAGVGGDPAAEDRAKAEAVHHLADPGPGDARRQPPQGGQPLQQLPAGHRLVQGRLLHGDPDGAPHRSRMLADVVAGDPGRSGGGGGQGGEDADGGGLARAVAAQVGVDLAVGGADGHLVQRPHAARVGLAQLRRLDRRLVHGPSL
jgi:hypothetical protein